MGLSIGTRQVTRAVSDGTGLSEEEIELLVAATALVTALVGLLRAVDAVMAVWPVPSGRARK
jgi:hypothetical protein